MPFSILKKEKKGSDCCEKKSVEKTDVKGDEGFFIVCVSSGWCGYDTLPSLKKTTSKALLLSSFHGIFSLFLLAQLTFYCSLHKFVYIIMAKYQDDTHFSN